MAFDGKALGQDQRGVVVLGEFGSMQVELYILSQRLQIPELADLADYPTRFLNQSLNQAVPSISI